MQSRGKREDIVLYMRSHQIDVLCLQETLQQHNTRETHRGFCWYFEAPPRKFARGRFATGVGMVIGP
eukprot:4380396-Prorocentrum_lima.AAC.1